MSNNGAFNVDCYSDFRHIPYPHPHITIASFKQIIRDAYGINYPFDLTYQCAKLCDQDQLEELKLGSDCAIRVRRCSIVDSNQSNPIVTSVPNSTTDIFLSYEWTHQRKMKLLERYLAANNYSCWLDVQEMYPSTLMHSAIEQGIRQSPVFICCINQKYGESDSCRRELSTAVALKKPIIPLIMEPLEWPPRNIAMMVADCIYVKFYKNSNTNDSLPWPRESFEKLLHSLAQHFPRT